MKWIRMLAPPALLLLGLGVCVSQAEASASTDTITISLTPNTTYAVTISSAYVGGYNFGQVNLNSTTVSTVAITLTNSGSIYEFFAISVSSPTAGGWTPSAVGASTDTFRLMGMFNGAVQPTQGNASFSAITGTPPTAASGKYGQASKTSPTTGSNSVSLWLQMDMPYTLNTGSSGPQTMTVSVTGQAT